MPAMWTWLRWIVDFTARQELIAEGESGVKDLWFETEKGWLEYPSALTCKTCNGFMVGFA